MSQSSQLPRYIAAYRLFPDEFWEDVARVFETLIKIDGQPTKVYVVGKNDFGYHINIWNQSGKLVGIIWADRNSPSHVIPADYIYDLIPTRQQLNTRYAFLVTTAQVNAGAHKIAKDAGIQIVDGEKYEQLRARAYGWAEPIATPLYFDGTPYEMNERRDASDSEMQFIRDARKLRPIPDKKVHTKTTSVSEIKDVEVPAAVTQTKGPSEMRTVSNGWDLSPEEQAVILAWRRGDKVKAAKIILND